jgi:hypothetical protein
MAATAQSFFDQNTVILTTTPQLVIWPYICTGLLLANDDVVGTVLFFSYTPTGLAGKVLSGENYATDRETSKIWLWASVNNLHFRLFVN